MIGYDKNMRLRANTDENGEHATVQGLRDPGLLRIEDRFDTRGRAYYWVGIERRRAEPPQGTDLWAVRSNLISVTPLCLDYTDQKSRERLAAALDGHGG